jgi:putative addiction module antidote
MVRKVFKTGNSLVVSLPKDALSFLGIGAGADVSVKLDKEQGLLIIQPIEPPLPGVDQTFAAQVAEFIEEYRPALEALAK